MNKSSTRTDWKRRSPISTPTQIYGKKQPPTSWMAQPHSRKSRQLQRTTPDSSWRKQETISHTSAPTVEEHFVLPLDCSLQPQQNTSWQFRLTQQFVTLTEWRGHHSTGFMNKLTGCNSERDKSCFYIDLLIIHPTVTNFSQCESAKKLWHSVDICWANTKWPLSETRYSYDVFHLPNVRTANEDAIR